MKKILFVTMEFPPHTGGVSRYYENLCAHISKEDCTILAQRTPSATDDSRFVLRRRIFFSRFLWPHWLPLLYHIFRELLSHRYDVVVVGQVLPVGIPVALLTFFFRIPFVVFVHGMDAFVPIQHVGKRRLLQKMLRFILRRAARVFAISTFTREYLVSLGIPSSSVILFPPAVSPLASNISSLSSSDVPTLLSVGRLVERKGFDMVLRALPRVLQEYPRLRYLIVGSGPYFSSLQKLSDALRLSDHVTFFDRLSDNDLALRYAQADIFLMPDRKVGEFDVEGFGIVFLEAALFGKPSIAGNASGASDAVLDGETGFVVDGTNPDEISHAILRLLRDPDLRKKFGSTARQRVLRDFSWQDRSRKFQEHISTL